MKNIDGTTGTKIVFFDAAADYRFFKKKFHDAFDDVGETGKWIMARHVEILEQKITDRIQMKYGVGCASGTDAITLSLLALGIKPHHEVIVPANCYPSIFGVVAAGARPVLIDVDTDTGHLDYHQLPSVVTRDTKAIILVHLYGQGAEIEEVKKFAQDRSIFLIEDCAQAFGAYYKNRPVGSFGDLSVLSFYPTKNLGGLGDGGMVLTNSKKLEVRLRMWRMYGEKKRYASLFAGKNSRLDEIQAAFLLTKLPFLNRFIRKKQLLAGFYRKYLSSLPEIEWPSQLPHRLSTYHLLIIKVRERVQLQRWLAEQGIETAVHYPKPIHKTRAFRHLGRNKKFPVAEAWSRKVLSLPLHPYMAKRDVIFVTEKISAFYKKTMVG